MRAFVTGGTGFIGRHLVRRLVATGYEVHAVAGNRAVDNTLGALGAITVPGHITDRASLQGAMSGSDIVFHAANSQLATYEDAARAQTQIVTGTQHVLGAAHELGIPKIIYFSSLDVFGNTHGLLVDESYSPPRPPEGAIHQALWHAHYDVAQKLVEQGAPIITLMPGIVFGPGETGWLGNLMRRFYRGSLYAVPAPETTFTYAYVDDIVSGALLAAGKGRTGETYCLAGPAIPLGELVEFWSMLIGRAAPSISFSARSLRATPLFGNRIVDEGLRDRLGGTFMAASNKARIELGWSTQPMQTTTLETFEWLAASEPAGQWEKRRHTGLLVLAGAAAMGATWLLARPHNNLPTQQAE